jgi:hypothetical protein
MHLMLIVPIARSRSYLSYTLRNKLLVGTLQSLPSLRELTFFSIHFLVAFVTQRYRFSSNEA